MEEWQISIISKANDTDLVGNGQYRMLSYTLISKLFGNCIFGKDAEGNPSTIQQIVWHHIENTRQPTVEFRSRTDT